MQQVYWPTELRLSADKRTLAVAFDDGARYSLDAEYLRVMSPSAEVKGHAPDQKKTVAGKKSVMILAVDPVGNYAVRLQFDDMHDTGLYTWDLLRDLGARRDRHWGEYLEELAAKGLSR
ncbi:MAG: hypothetical protein BGP06_10110 [Rhizobiales bacterium 65-9]|nr:DUF971 domain-containing protein [Hyphomicrobiales bacterium]OJY33243.1 MAG: hypothetical protein BGP06_10110 [Rhizobiales bacterium 65-9]